MDFQSLVRQPYQILTLGCKDSIGCISRKMPVSELLGILDDAEKEKREFSAVVDLR